MSSRVKEYCSDLTQFATQYMGGTAREVRGSSGLNATEIADNLDSLLLLVKSRMATDATCGGCDIWADKSFAAADRVRSMCWEQMSEEGGWPNVGWREAYAFALIVLALVHIHRHDSGSKDDLVALREAIKNLDLALIMSGSGSAGMVHTILNGIEPEVEAARYSESSCDQAEDGGEKYVIGHELAAAIAPLLDAACAIPRVKAITLADFKKNFFKADKSCIIEGSIEDWPARSKWQDLRYLTTHFGHRTVPVELGKLQGGRKMAGWKEEAILLSDFVQDHLVPSNLVLQQSTGMQQGTNLKHPENQANVAYLAQHALFEQLPRLQRDLRVPQYTECGQLEAINAWLGTAGTVTPLHHDSYDNLLTQVVGFKYVCLFS
jgi:hypothetical protein